MAERELTVLHLFAGLGGGALGFQRARFGFGDHTGRFRTLLGVDFSAEACADFTTLTGAPALQADVHELTSEQLREAAGPRAPDVVFTSPPCKGFSGLLSNATAKTEKYQRLNQLVLEGLAVTLGAWSTPPKLILLENVPRIASRGADLLRRARQLLGAHGYVFHEGAHDCGELGGLAQHRRRYLIIARHEAQVPVFVYEPPKRRVRAIGEVLESMPLPDDPAAGPMHRCPRLKWKTWVRLALIPAGGDWRALGTTSDSARFNNTFRIVPWGSPSVAVTGGGTPTSGGVCAADPRLESACHRGIYKVVRWDETSGTVTGRASVSTGGFAVADPRFSGPIYKGKYAVMPWANPSRTVIGGPSNGADFVADPRIGGKGSRPDLMGVLPWGRPAKTISGSASVTGSNCPAAVADPRIPGPDDRPDPPPAIIAEDGTWHRPLTTLELAALQGLPTSMPDGSPLELAGQSHTRWRERIGNAVPPPTAQAIATEVGRALLAAAAGATFVLGGGGIWVRDEEARG